MSEEQQLLRKPNSNPLLEDLESASIIPNVNIGLPTRAYFYPKDQVLTVEANPDDISVRPISVLDESTIHDPIMLVSGQAITKMIARVCPEVVDPENLCEIDVQAIIIASRMATRGNEFEIKKKCKKCEKESAIKIDLNEHIQNYSPYDVEFLENNFTMTLEFEKDGKTIEQMVYLRPILYKDAIKANIEQLRTQNENLIESEGSSVLSDEFLDKYKEVYDKALHTNASVVSSSIYYIKTSKDTKIYNRDNIHEWYTKLDDVKADKIISKLEEIHDEIRDKSKIQYECDKCNNINHFYFELDVQKLFTLAEDSKLRKNFSANSKNTEKKEKKPSKRSQRLS